MSLLMNFYSVLSECEKRHSKVKIWCSGAYDDYFEGIVERVCMDYVEIKTMTGDSMYIQISAIAVLKPIGGLDD